MNILGKLVLCIILKFIICSADSDADENETGNTTESSANVIIIGSGPAGIAAAAKLLENNITNIKILEAENRIGGRIYSVQFGDSIVDLGAQWCHGEEGNLVYQLASPLNLLENDPYDNYIYYHSSQKNIDSGIIEQISDIAHNIYEEPRNDTDSSLGEYILQRFNATITKNYGNSPNKTALAHEIINEVHLAVLAEEGAFSWFDVAAQSGYKITRGPQTLGWKGLGYKIIFDVLTKKYPDPNNELEVYKKVILKKDVIKLSSFGDTPKVTCSDNTTYRANHVIWTPSLGVLKHRYKYLFEPALPKEKINAIEALGIGAVMKVFYYFPNRWWPKHLEGFAFIWSKQDGQSVWEEFPYGSNTQGRSWLLAFEAILINQYNPDVLTAWICGTSVPSIEKFDDDLIINGTMFLLYKFLGHQFHNITRPQKIIREKWYSNDHFRGTYSYDTLQSRKGGISQRDHLSTPLKTADGKPVVLFAGEATHPIHYSTVHGAIESGRREADRIISYYKENPK